MLTGTTVSMLRRTRTTKGGGTRIEPKAQLGTALNRASVGVQQRSGNVSRTTRRSHNIPGVVRWLYRQRWSGATVSTVGSVKVTNKVELLIGRRRRTSYQKGGQDSTRNERITEIQLGSPL